MDSSKLKNPMTKDGYVALADEYNELLNVTRPKVVQGVADAAAEGDRSENAEYIYGRKRLREIDKRLRYLTSLIKDVQVIDPTTLHGKAVCFGATGVVQDEAGATKAYTLVGEGESNAAAGLISWKSPVGKALMGKKIGDLFEVGTPSGTVEFEVIDIKFAGKSIRAG
jgi:transcription elongation factor GreB